MLNAIDSFDNYLSKIRKIPVLPYAHERALLVEYINTNNPQTAQTIILHNLRFVVHIARRYSNYGVPLADLVQEGNIALMKALTKFKLDFCNRFISFAVHDIKSKIKLYCMRNAQIINKYTTKSLMKLYNNAHKYDWDKPNIAQISNDLNITHIDVYDYINRIKTSYIDSDELSEYIVGCDDTLTPLLNDNNTVIDQVYVILNTLDERKRTIFTLRHLTSEVTTLDELSKMYNISKERVRQLESEVLKLIQSRVVQ